MNPRIKAKLSRRDFMAMAVAGAWLLLDRVRPVDASEPKSKETWGMLIDLTRCVGCNSCVLACKESNHLPGDDQIPQALESDAYSFVEPVEVITANGESTTRYVKRQCMHCLNAACVSACPAAAMYDSGEGPVIYRADRCLGCRYCLVGCPFGVPRFDWQDGIAPTISKCWMCYDRLQAGGEPACVEACPAGAVRFGRRSELLIQARAQIATRPERYVDHVFGESEVGGTSVVYLSDVPFEQLGFPLDLPHVAPSEQTEKVMSTLPFVIGGMAVLMSGAALYTHRLLPDEREE
jgi:formate dehydrogenase iron-sulfur subunit